MYSNQNTNSFMPEEDLLYTILADLKRTSREYTTATTESACPTVRQLFNDLTGATLRQQGDLFRLMQQNQMYTLGGKALRQEMDKQIQEAHKTQQKCQQFMQQKQASTSGMYGQAQQQGHYGHTSNSYYM
ncbi:spore coat protein [Paenibacillus massiliensis]|uniref:spore coat protein n=1 Tax=Paenibacillus massiliensis TaxID=225917 RepID=UPI0003F6A1DB|nr:spore coat protein [Paenibacillus massiliensis]